MPESQAIPQFPWPPPTPAQIESGQLSGSAAMVIVMDQRGLTLAERCLALYLADGSAGPHGTPDALLEALEITEDTYLDLLWSLFRKGTLQAIAGRW